MIKKISIIVALLIIGVNISAQTLNLNNKFNVQSEEIDEKEKMSQDLIVVNKLNSWSFVIIFIEPSE